MITDAERNHAAELTRVSMEANRWNLLLNRCGNAVGMRAGDDMDAVPERVEARIALLEGYVADREKTIESARGVAKDLTGQIRVLVGQLEELRLASLPGPYVGGLDA